jgi:hypothetical protein
MAVVVTVTGAREDADIMQQSEKDRMKKGRQGRSGARNKPKRTMTTNAPLGASHTSPRGRRWEGDSGGQGRDQGTQRSDVSTEQLPASTRTSRGCLVGEG